MRKAEEYLEQLKARPQWDDYLLENSGLPGPRGNLELAEAVAGLGKEETFLRYVSLAPEKAPENTPEVFLAFCGTVGLGRLISEGRIEYIKVLQSLASDPRWRIREAVAMALQRYGAHDMDGLIREMEHWAEGNEYEKRAAAAGLCEPKLLKHNEQVIRVLRILDRITGSIRKMEDRKGEGFQALKKGLAYCWSVAIVGAPDEGKKMFERWIQSDDRDIDWIIRENLKKNRLKMIDDAWLRRCKDRMGIEQ